MRQHRLPSVRNIECTLLALLFFLFCGCNKQSSERQQEHEQQRHKQKLNEDEKTKVENDAIQITKSGARTLKITPIQHQVIELGESINVVASIEEWWSGKVLFTLAGQSPSSAQIDAKTGAIRWTPKRRGFYQFAVSVQSLTDRSDFDSVPLEVSIREPGFELPIPPDIDTSDPDEISTLRELSKEARTLRFMASENAGKLRPDLATLKKMIRSPTELSHCYAGRDPRARVELLERNGGSLLTEAAVARGLRWLAKHQNSDGSWSIHTFEQVKDCNCGGIGRVNDDVGGTALALLPFLGAGQTIDHGRFRKTVERGLNWLISKQNPDGSFSHEGDKFARMYSIGIASRVLCEAVAMMDSEEIRQAAVRATQFVVDSQNNDGGWRYSPKPPTQKGDMSITGWKICALHSARAAGIHVPANTLKKANGFLDVMKPKRASEYHIEVCLPHFYTYLDRAGAQFGLAVTAEALLCRFHLGWYSTHDSVVAAVKLLNERFQPDISRQDMYYWYYGTLMMRHMGGRIWENWNDAIVDILINGQATKGHQAGSWPSDEPNAMKDIRWGDHGGRILLTSLATCILESYYQYLPRRKATTVGIQIPREPISIQVVKDKSKYDPCNINGTVAYLGENDRVIADNYASVVCIPRSPKAEKSLLKNYLNRSFRSNGAITTQVSHDGKVRLILNAGEEYDVFVISQRSKELRQPLDDNVFWNLASYFTDSRGRWEKLNCRWIPISVEGDCQLTIGPPIKPEQSVMINGNIEFARNETKIVPDRGAMVIAFPKDFNFKAHRPSVDEPQSIDPNERVADLLMRLRDFGARYTRLFRSKLYYLALPEPGNYSVLIVSNNVKRNPEKTKAPSGLIADIVRDYEFEMTSMEIARDLKLSKLFTVQNTDAN